MSSLCSVSPLLCFQSDAIFVVSRPPSPPIGPKQHHQTLDLSCSFRLSEGQVRAAQGTISWTTPEPDFNPLVSFFTLHLADDAFLGVHKRENSEAFK